MLFRIKPDRPDGGEADRNDVVAPRLDLIVEVRLVLKRIGVEVAVLQRLVRLGVVVEHDELDVEAFRLRLLGHHRPDVLVLRAHDADAKDLLFGVGAGRRKPWRERQYSGQNEAAIESHVYGLQRSGSSPPRVLVYYFDQINRLWPEGRPGGQTKRRARK